MCDERARGDIGGVAMRTRGCAPSLCRCALVGMGVVMVGTRRLWICDD